MFKVIALWILVSFVEAQIVQWVTIYTDKKSIKWMFKWFMYVWGTMLGLHAVCFTGGYGLYLLCDLLFE